jgi:hypothetical protein
MTKFDYDAPAELFPAPTRKSKRPGKYRRFDTAADAIRFVVEELPAPMVSGTVLETENERIAGEAIRALYDSNDYPLKRSLN